MFPLDRLKKLWTDGRTSRPVLWSNYWRYDQKSFPEITPDYFTNLRLKNSLEISLNIKIAPDSWYANLRMDGKVQPRRGLKKQFLRSKQNSCQFVTIKVCTDRNLKGHSLRSELKIDYKKNIWATKLETIIYQTGTMTSKSAISSYFFILCCNVLKRFWADGFLKLVVVDFWWYLPLSPRSW